MTKIIYISGVHGAGKTTVIRKLANKLRRTGSSVFVFQEFSYPPDIEIGTMEFQKWYAEQMDVRQNLIRSLFENEGVDYILCDRHPIDVDVYTNRLLQRLSNLDYLIDIEGKIRDWVYSSFVEHYVLERNPRDIVDSIMGRMEDEVHRREWGEENILYVKEIMDGFRALATRNNIRFVTNDNIDETVETILADIMMSDEEWIG